MSTDEIDPVLGDPVLGDPVPEENTTWHVPEEPVPKYALDAYDELYNPLSSTNTISPHLPINPNPPNLQRVISNRISNQDRRNCWCYALAKVIHKVFKNIIPELNNETRNTECDKLYVHDESIVLIKGEIFYYIVFRENNGEYSYIFDKNDSFTETIGKEVCFY